MHAVGAWLKANGEAVYDTRPGPIQGLEWCRGTRRGSSVFLHVFDWPTDGLLRVPGVVSSARLLAGGTSLPVRGEGASTVIDTAGVTPDAIDTVLVLE